MASSTSPVSVSRSHSKISSSVSSEEHRLNLADTGARDPLPHYVEWSFHTLRSQITGADDIPIVTEG